MSKHTPGTWRVKHSTGFDAQDKLVGYAWVGVGPITHYVSAGVGIARRAIAKAEGSEK